MMFDYRDRWHVPVEHGGPDEAEAPPLQIAAKRVRLVRRGGELAYGFSSILSRPAVDETPAIRVETALFFLHGQKTPCVFHPGGDLHAGPGYPWIGGLCCGSHGRGVR